MSNTIDRRKFLRSAAMGAVGISLFPQLLNAKSLAPDQTIRIGFIGLGQQAMHLMSGFMKIPNVEVLAGCDVYGVKRLRFEKRVKDAYAKKGKEANVTLYEDYRELLKRKDINTVVIASPDHWHAFMAIDACKAKKDIYLEKPLTFTIKEGQELVKAVRKNKVILAVGSQQRSDTNFQHAVKMVQNGRIGKVLRVNACVGEPPKPYNLPEETIPADLNWKMWLGPLKPTVHYNARLDPAITLDPETNEAYWAEWRYFQETGGGFTTDWGAHMFDIAQWGLGMDRNGPIEIIPPGYQDTKYLTFKYANGTVMTEEPFNEKNTKGVKFWGETGWIEISREYYLASDDSLLPPKITDDKTSYESRSPHHVNFIEAIRNRKDPIVPVEIGHSSCVVCTLGNIAYELKRPLKWNPKKEKFVDDSEADSKITRAYNPGYKI